MRQFIVCAFVAVQMLAAAPAGKPAVSRGKAFDTPEAAAQALVGAAKSGDLAEILAILGPSAREIVSTRDKVADRNMRRAFVKRASQSTRLAAVRGKPNERMLQAGNDGWQLPVPIVQVNGKWYFDMAQGRKRILTRRIGSNELDAIEVCRGYVEAQNSFAEVHRTAAGVPYYAQKIISSPGEHDGLYWKDDTADESPIGEIIAKAIAEGYTNKQEPFHGYFFRILTAQGQHSYIEDGVMTKGFALIAWPAQYGSTGIMTFLVDKSGIVYQKDLGRNTEKLVSDYSKYDPNATWKPVSGGAALMSKLN